MSADSKKPPEFGPVREYKAHFELWDEAAIDDAGAPPLDNGRRVWTTPVLSITPIVEARPRKPAAPPSDTSALGYWMMAAAAAGAVLAVLVMRPWKSDKVTVPPAMKVQASPKAIPSVSIYAKQAVTAPAKAPVAVASKVAVAAHAKIAVVLPKKPAAIPSIAASAPRAMSSSAAPAKVAVAGPMKPAAIPSIAASAPRAMSSSAAPAKVAVAAPMKPLAMPSVAAPAKPAAESSSAAPVKVASVPEVKAVAKPAQVEPTIETPPESPSAGDEDEEDEFAPVRTQFLESSIRSQLAGAGFSSLGVSVTEEGDVFLDGTFLNLADEDRVIAMVRGDQGVRDIYFSGTVWHNLSDHLEEATAPGLPAPTANGATASVPAQSPVANPPASSQQPAPSAHGKIAHSAEFPVTAAEAPAPRTRYAGPPAPQPSAAPTADPARRSMLPFRWPMSP